MRKSIPVKLTSEEIKRAAIVAIDRQIDNIENNRQPAYDAGRENDWQLSIEGCLGEYAVAKEFGLYWDGNVGNLKAADVGNIEVRTTSRQSGSLILHPKDNDHRPFILVTGVNGTYSLRGWFLGKDGKQDKFWRKDVRHPAYFVHQNSLYAFGPKNDPLPGITVIPF